MKKTAIFPGTFDPFTKGHESLLKRALHLFDHIVIGVGINENKNTVQPHEERVKALKQLFSDDDRITVESYSDLTIDLAQRHQAAFILRGVRSIKDYEYELNMADVNRRLSGIETIILFTEPEWAFLSSSVVRELHHFGKDILPFIPEGLKYP
ncbi:MAG: pantetheine-phosphate adenylyltransferase [Paraprevotella sp.]|jgi:pantetheine-phosphate adenylyltransferase|nr:pantetheine-phosphate adenylyltransferase [Paraprevotella sp.]